MHLAVSIFDIDIVITGTTESNKLNAHCIELVYNKRIDIVIYEHAYNVTAFSKFICVRRKTCLKESDIKLPVFICSLKRLPVVFLRIKESYL